MLYTHDTRQTTPSASARPLPESMSARDAVISELSVIGDLLDRDEYPYVGENGRVTPGSDQTATYPGNGDSHEGTQRRTYRPEARQGQRSTFHRTTQEGAEALLVSESGLGPALVEELVGARAAYPSMRISLSPRGAWLLVAIQPLVSLRETGFILTQLGIDNKTVLTTVKSWAWWDVGIRIGPRHTNYGDGSICSYEPTHRTWRVGDPLGNLLDLNSLWICRHQHLRFIGRWPGDQTLHTAFERLAEHRPGELCGCGSLRPYTECHKHADLLIDPVERRRLFSAHAPNASRRIPEEVWDRFLHMRSQTQFLSPPGSDNA